MFNYAKQLLKTVNILASPVLVQNQLIKQQARNVYIFKRHHRVNLTRGKKSPILKSKHFIYHVVEDTNYSKKRPLLDLILLTPVEGVGEVGSRVQVQEPFGYRELLLPKKAVYASPENIAKYANIITTHKAFSSLIAPKNAKLLSKMRIGIGMSPYNPWTIENWHIRVGLRMNGVTAPDDAITLPDKPISGPNLEYEGKEFPVTITINNHEQVKVRCAIYHTISLHDTEFPEDYWKYPNEAVFPEFQEILDSMPMFENEFSTKSRPDLQSPEM